MKKKTEKSCTKPLTSKRRKSKVVNMKVLVSSRMKTLKLNKNQLAVASGVSRQHIQYFFKEGKIGSEHLAKLFSVLGLEIRAKE